MLPSRSEVAHNQNVMETTTSFAPLAGRLAAKVAEIRPAAGAKVSWANFMALFLCAIVEMLILLCETLDARAAAEAAGLPTARDAAVRAAPAIRSGHAAMPRGRPVPRLAPMDNASSTLLARAASLAGPAAPHPEGHLPAWSPPWPELCWRPPRLGVLPRKRVLAS